MDTVFLKLGGSLITDKRSEETPRLDVLERLAQEIAEARRTRPDMQLVIGHGSGSFGHIHGQRHGTRQGVSTAEEWFGFALTADAASRLTRIVVTALVNAGIPAWSIQPSATLRCTDGRIVAGPEGAVAEALERGLVPVVHGDVALDNVRGGTIASTEEIFNWLLPNLNPTLLILAGEVDGLYTSDPHDDPGAQLISEVQPGNYAAIQRNLGGSYGVDVTGGMQAKIDQAIGMVSAIPGLEVVVCSGLVEDALYKRLVGVPLAGGTRIHS